MGILTSRPADATGSSEKKWDAPQVNDSLYELYKPQGTDKPSMQIIFFHGLQLGDYSQAHMSTWESADGSQVWPQTWLVEEFPGAHVFSVACNAGAGNSMDVEIIKENLMTDLLQAKIGQLPFCPVVLVGHSIGGLVIKQVCLHANENLPMNRGESAKLGKFLENLKGIFYYATPHHGLHPVVYKLADRIHNPYFKFLSTDGGRLRSKFDSLREIHQDWSVAGLGEARPTNVGPFSGMLVVPEASSRGENYNVVEGADHFTISKPASKTSRSFFKLKGFLQQIARDSEQEQKKHEQEELSKRTGSINSSTSINNCSTTGIDGIASSSSNRTAKMDRIGSSSNNRPPSIDRIASYDRTTRYDFPSRYDRMASYDRIASYDRTARSRSDGRDWSSYDHPSRYDRTASFDRPSRYDRTASFDRPSRYDRIPSYERTASIDKGTASIDRTASINNNSSANINPTASIDCTTSINNPSASIDRTVSINNSTASINPTASIDRTASIDNSTASINNPTASIDSTASINNSTASINPTDSVKKDKEELSSSPKDVQEELPEKEDDMDADSFDWYDDPLTWEKMCDPVMCSDGRTYDRWTVLDQRLRRSPYDPSITTFGILCDDITTRSRLFKAFPEQELKFHQRRKEYREEALRHVRAHPIDFEKAVEKLSNVLKWLPVDKECQRELVKILG